MSVRLDRFEGPLGAYTAYLEQQVVLLRQHHATCGRAHSESLKEASLSAVPVLSSSSSAPCISVKRRCGLEIVQYDHGSTREKCSKPRKKPQKPRWEQVAATLIGETPRAHDWQKLLKEKGIYEIMSSGSAVAHLLGDTHNSASIEALDVIVVDKSASDGALGRIQAYAYAAIRRETNASVALVLANFQKFLALSACAVLAATGSPNSHVFDIVRICIGNVSTEYCTRMLRVVVYLNELLDTLYMHGWGLRASELLLLCKSCASDLRSEILTLKGNRSPSFFYHLTSAGDKGLQYFKAELCVMELTSTVERTASWTPLFVPSLVHNLVGKSIE